MSQVSEHKHGDVVFEIAFAINALISTSGASLTEPTWDTMVLIMRNCMDLWDHDYIPATGRLLAMRTYLDMLKGTLNNGNQQQNFPFSKNHYPSRYSCCHSGQNTSTEVNDCRQNQVVLARLYDCSTWQRIVNMKDFGRLVRVV